MERLLRIHETGFYLKSDGTLTTERIQAYNFPSYTAAWNFANKHKIAGLEVVLSPGKAHQDIVLPVYR